MTSGTRERVELREALELMVRELKAYACKHGLGPAKLQYALSQGEAALAAVEREGALVAPIKDLIAYHEKVARDHVSSQWIYGNHMMAVQAYKKVLGMIAALERTAQSPVAPASEKEQQNGG